MKMGSCVALGDFDGIHHGHRKVIEAAVREKEHLIPTVYTFKANCKGSSLITDNKTKIEILTALGIEQIIIDEFETVKELSPAQFVIQVLINRLNAKKIICGEDFRFGKDAVGDAYLLSQLCTQHNIEFESVKSFSFTDKKLSSSDIRESILCGNMEKAALLLGRRYSVRGIVKHGKGIGSKNYTPTANIELSNNCVVPCFGVYITYTYVDGIKYQSISNVGVRPSFENTTSPNIETNLFDFSGDLYGKEIIVEFVKMIRTEKKFDSKHNLYSQIEFDIQTAKTFFDGEANE